MGAMIKESNNAQAASDEDIGAESPPDNGPKASAAEGSLAPHALPNEAGLEPEDLAVLPGHGKSGSGKRIASATAVIALLLLGVYSFTRGSSAPATDEEPRAASQPVAVKAAPKAAPNHEPQAKAEQPDSPADEDPTAPARGLPMMMAPPAADAPTEAPDLGPNGPSVGRFPDLPPAVVSYLKRVEAAAKQDATRARDLEPAQADAPEAAAP